MEADVGNDAWSRQIDCLGFVVTEQSELEYLIDLLRCQDVAHNSTSLVIGEQIEQKIHLKLYI